MNPKEIADYMKKGLLAKGASDVVITASTRKAHQIKYSNNKVNATKSWELTDIGVFAVHDKRVVVTNTRDISKESADDAIKNIISLAKASHPNKDFKGIAQGPFKYKDIEDGYDKKIAELGEKGIDQVEEAINLSLAQGAKRCSGVFEYGEDSLFLTTSNDVEAFERSTKAYFSIRAFKDKIASGHMVNVSRVFSKLDLDSTVKKAVSIANQATNPQNIPAGKYDIVFDHLPYANIIAHVADAASIFAVESGLSCLGSRIGDQIGSDIINLVDDATLVNGFNSTSFDAEGVPTRRNQIIEKGILKTYLHNTSTAKRYGTQTTANAGLISPEAFNIELEAGDYSKEELISQVKRGLYLTNVWYTRFQNYNTGEFSTIPRDGAFLIENGKITHPVKNIRLSDNILNIIKSTKALGKKSVQIQGWEVETPTIIPKALVKSLNITQSEK